MITKDFKLLRDYLWQDCVKALKEEVSFYETILLLKKPTLEDRSVKFPFIIKSLHHNTSKGYYAEIENADTKETCFFSFLGMELENLVTLCDLVRHSS